MERYKEECKMLSSLARRQLNLSKNKIKENFENLSLLEIQSLINEELQEVYVEILNIIRIGMKNLESKEQLNNLLFEIGDTAGCLVGFIAKINQMQKRLK